MHPRRGRDEDCTQQRYDSVPRNEKKAEESAGGEEKEKTEAYFGSSVDDEEKPAVTEDVVSLPLCADLYKGTQPNMYLCLSNSIGIDEVLSSDEVQGT